MKIIKLGAGKGKTLKAIKLSAKTGAVIVCWDQREIDSTMYHAKYLQLNIPRPITVSEMFEGSIYNRRPIKGLIIDNFDRLIRERLGYWCKGKEIVALTTEDGTLSKILNKNHA